MPPTNAEYQLSYYQPLSYGMDVTGGHGTWTATPSAGHIGGGGGYPPPTHTTSTLYAAPMNDLYRHHPPPPPPPSHNGTTSYGVQPDYTSVFDYARAWQPSVMTHGPEPTKSSMQQHHDYYRNSGYSTSASNDDHHHQHAQQHYRDLNHHMSHLTVSPSSVPAAVGHHPHQGFGPVTGGGAQQPTSAPPPPPPPPPNKPLTWADKVKQVPKDATNSYKSKKIPIGGIAGAAQRKPPPPPPSSNLSPSPLLPPPPLAPPTTTSPQWTSPTVAVSTRPSWNSGDRILTNGAVESLPTAISRNGGGSDRTTKTTPTPVVKSDNDENDDDTSSEDTVARLKRETNPSELSMTVKGARFFVIKSYSEDDVHRSIKYGIWCSTEHGNKRLDAAFRERDRHGGGPIYLLFSVNASGHFCGIAQMMSAVDYDTQSGVWAQDKWKGLFRVRWLYVKDVPNQQLRSIRLENNENKPVTNSRDTQEVPHEKGRQVIRIVHEFRHTTSLFDDFSHYEQRQRESVAAGGGGGGSRA